MLASLALFLLTQASQPHKALPPPRAPLVKAPKGSQPHCLGTYADAFTAVAAEASALSAKPQAQFSYCIRLTATYECLSYATDGSIRRSRKPAVSHGTAFAYRRQGAETLLLTNEHVSEYPSVTSEEAAVADIGLGCKKVSEALKIVDDERDGFEGDDIHLTKVVTDPALDAAILKARAPLNVMPWRVGRSAFLRERNVVEVRGFPLGALRTVTQGRVTNVFDHDDYQNWNHDDFVIDAQLSAGHSGSPVLAVNCRTGQFELVGLFHAGYARGNSLNVVVQIDQLHELMTTLKRNQTRSPGQLQLSGQSRRRVQEELRVMGRLFAPFGPLTVEITGRPDGPLNYVFYSREFPARNWPIAVMEDLVPADAEVFGLSGRVWFGGPRGLKEHAWTEMAKEGRVTADRAIDLARRLAVASTELRAAQLHAATSREANAALQVIEKNLLRLADEGKDLAPPLLDLAAQGAPAPNDVALLPGSLGAETQADESPPSAPQEADAGPLEKHDASGALH